MPVELDSSPPHWLTIFREPRLALVLSEAVPDERFIVTVLLAIVGDCCRPSSRGSTDDRPSGAMFSLGRGKVARVAAPYRHSRAVNCKTDEKPGCAGQTATRTPDRG